MKEFDWVSVLIVATPLIFLASILLFVAGSSSSHRASLSSIEKLQAELDACKAREKLPPVWYLYTESTADGKEKVLVCDKYPHCIDITELIERRANQLANIRFSYFFYSVRTDAEYRQIVCSEG